MTEIDRYDGHDGPGRCFAASKGRRVAARHGGGDDAGKRVKNMKHDETMFMLKTITILFNCLLL